MPCPCRAHAVPLCASSTPTTTPSTLQRHTSPLPMPCPCRARAVPMQRPCPAHAPPMPHNLDDGLALLTMDAKRTFIGHSEDTKKKEDAF